MKTQADRTFRESLLAVLGIAFVVAMVAIDQTVVGTALPTIVAELRGFELYPWVATAYLLTSVITIPIFGRLGDYYGRKPFLVAAIALFTGASMLCAAANSMVMLVIARALQGIGGGMLVGTAFACIPDLFPDAHVRLRWQVIVSSSFGIANAIGPSLGGVLTHALGWRSIFFVNLPVGLLGLYVVARHMPHIRHAVRGEARIDWVGAIMITVMLGAFQLLVQFSPSRGLSTVTVLLGALCVAAGVALVVWERRIPHPLIPPDLFADPRVGGLLILAALTGFSMFALLFYAPLLLQGGFGMTARDAGLLITPLVVCITFGSVINGRIIVRLRVPNVMLYVGFGLLGVCLLGVILTYRSTPAWLFSLYMFIGGFGLGFIMPNLNVFAQDTVERSRLGIVTALLQSLRMVGAMVGTALVGSIVNYFYLRDLTATLSTLQAERWRDVLDDPQVLVSEAAQQQFLAQAGDNGMQLVEAARQALVSSIHYGELLALLIVGYAMWRIRKVPPISLRRRG